MTPETHLQADVLGVCYINSRSTKHEALRPSLHWFIVRGLWGVHSEARVLGGGKSFKRRSAPAHAQVHDKATRSHA
jgi:hypothetical protein